MLDIDKLGAEIRRLRKKAGITQEELAEKLNVRFQAVSNWERGITPPGIDNLVELSEFFGVSVDAIIKPSDEEYYIGVDAGGTKTEFVLFTADGRVLKRLTLGSCNPHDIGMTACKNTLMEGIEKITVDYPRISTAFVGLAGAGLVSVNDEINAYLKERTRITKAIVDSDTYSIFALADADIALLSGTGMVVLVKKDTLALGGWGYMFDESGSGYDVGKDALRACMFYEDGIGEPTSLHDVIKSMLYDGKVPEKDYLIRAQTEKIYKGGKKFVASFAPIVIREYREGDKVARDIIEKSVKHMATLLNRAIKYSGTDKVIASGGFIVNNKEILLPLFKKYTSAKLVFSDLPPVYGACRECLRRVNVEESVDFKENFKKTYDLIRL